MRNRSIAPSLGLLAALIVASAALAGGWAQVSPKNIPVDPPAGEPTTIEVALFQHGVTLTTSPSLTVIATDADSGAVVRAEAVADPKAGSYTATIVFPTAGSWTLTFDSADLIMEGEIAMAIGPALTGAQGSPSGAAAVDVMPFAVLLFVAVVGLAVAGLALVGRRRSVDTQATA